VHLHLAGRTFVNLHFLMGFSIVVRLLHALLVVPRLPEQPRETAGGLVRHLAGWPFQRVARVWSRPRL
jgi:hypothetical protein